MTTTTIPLRERIKDACRWMSKDIASAVRDGSNAAYIAERRAVLDDLRIVSEDAVQMALFDAYCQGLEHLRAMVDGQRLVWLFSRYRRGIDATEAAIDFRDIWCSEYDEPEREPDDAD